MERTLFSGAISIQQDREKNIREDHEGHVIRV
jgi:hypothetical protein